MKVLQLKRRAPGRSAASTLFWTAVRSFIWLTFRLLYRYRTAGAEHIPERGPVVFASNHQSHLDPVIVGVLVWDRPCTYIARSNLFDFGPFAWFIRFLGAIPVERGKPDKAAMDAARTVLDHGATMLFFPEGTRSGDGALGTFRRGAIVLARRTKSPIVPIALEGAADIWPRERKLPRLRGWISVQAGAAISPEQIETMGDQATLDLLRERIDAMRLELRATMRQRSGGRWPSRGAGDEPVAQDPSVP